MPDKDSDKRSAASRTSDMSHVRKERPPGDTQSVQTPPGNGEGQGGGKPPSSAVPPGKAKGKGN